MTSPLASAPVYGDFAGLESLKKAVRGDDPAAIRQVAKQFESLFARMLIKSMRNAVGRDPIFGSDQEQTYQEMYDDQLSLELTRGHGLGLADMLVRQLQRKGVTGAGQDSAGGGSASKADAAGAPQSVGSLGSLGSLRSLGSLGSGRSLPSMPAARSEPSMPARRSLPAMGSAGAAPSGETSRRGASPSPVASSADQKSFIHDVWPQARQAAEQLGVAPQSLVAQAALETNWGRNVPQDAAGRSSNNLFGIKAADGWDGPSVAAGTHEFQGGAARAGTTQFRAYGNRAQSFQDYVALLKSNPRYAAALNTGDNVQAFASALQRGGYATDPEYARKVGAVASDVANALADAGPAAGQPDASAESLKFASAGPIAAGTDSLL